MKAGPLQRYDWSILPSSIDFGTQRIELRDESIETIGGRKGGYVLNKVSDVMDAVGFKRADTVIVEHHYAHDAPRFDSAASAISIDNTIRIGTDRLAIVWQVPVP